jgi:hypothetical protein
LFEAQLIFAIGKQNVFIWKFEQTLFQFEKKIFLCSAKLSYFSDLKSDEQYGTKKIVCCKRASEIDCFYFVLVFFVATAQLHDTETASDI